MIISKETQKLIEEQMNLYEKRMVEEKFLEALWCLNRLIKVTSALRELKSELKGE